MSDIEIVALTADQWLDLKRLRIDALTESPDAFSPTAEDARSRGDGYWQRAARRAAGTDGFELFVVRRDGEALGLGSAQRDEGGVGHIGAMWIDPALRGRGIGAQLFDTIVAYLSGRGCAAIELSVTETNTAALALYRSRDFALTGQSEPLRAGSPLLNLFMRRARTNP